MTSSALIVPDWPAPAHIKAICTTRQAGFSPPPYDSLNLGDHVADDPKNVHRNRQQLITLADLPEMPLWLNQTHSTRVIDSDEWQSGIEADAIISERPGHVCSVLTADCLPLLVCDVRGNQVAAIHAGWRGLLSGIIETTVKRFNAPMQDLLVWLGPAIGPSAFEVGPEVYQAFTAHHAIAAEAFTASENGHHYADIYQLARQRLQLRGVHNIFGGEYCTFNQADQFFSYRRDGVTGRMASIIWLE
ncbi:hypothetical protein MPL1_04050 [Methylophaga lonarensis MPL]|uniref:Purine nucleoside phosphorylase n=1 Tax=Methylophaga lonarensis MPL TaxID=1286106 RepID=M7NY01_9GAMM|nr:peptidoglycan editing factor PgeF [Methylophaga lonarensis]EMR13678.1 hypothetical protein MPL1_04050 [Methylophaga lonarensis MPL]